MISIAARDTMIPVKNFLMMLLLFGGFQLIFLFQVYYSSTHQVPTQCDCQCTKQLHITTGNKNNNEPIKFLKDKGLNNSNDERTVTQILDAEDKELDEQWHEKNSNETIAEGAEDKIQRDKNGEWSKIGETYVTYQPLKYNRLALNADINDRRSRCNQPHTDTIVIYVYTAPGNFKERDTVRKTWGSVKEFRKIKLKTIFFIGGLSSITEVHYAAIHNESVVYGDIVQDNSYIDAYRNLTLKGVSALQWINKYCPEAYRVVKVDDDTLVNPYNLVKFLSGQTEETMSELICKVTRNVGPIRNPKRKYYVSVQEYALDLYPDYCQGYGYIIPPKLIPLMLAKLPSSKLLVMEDVFFTGLLRQLAVGNLHALTPLFTTTYNTFDGFLERITARADLLFIGHVHDKESAEIFWQLVNVRAKKEEGQRKPQVRK